MDVLALFIFAIIVGIAIAIGVWWYRYTLLALNDFHYWLNREVIDPLIASVKELIRKREFIKWKKEELPNLVERTRKDDRDALAERIVKSKHVRGDNEK